jgi:DNA invertase Pin-like site-specific DNA recombinase
MLVPEVSAMGERARLWQRVSTGGQDEASQLPDLISWCDTHEYQYSLDERYVVHGKSAYHKKQEKTLNQAISDMANGHYAVLVVWFFDRIQRGSTLDAFMLAERARAAGGRIEYVHDAYLNETNEMSDVMLALAATAARQESERKSKRIRAKHNALRAEGSAIGRPPWGYYIKCDVCKTPARMPKCKPHKKIFSPTPDGCKYIPLIFDMVINGRSLRFIAAWLDGEAVKTLSGKSWHEQYIGHRIIKNPIYYGERRNAGQLETEALITFSVWQQANAALASRVRPGRSTVKREKSMLAPVCGNPECDASGEHPGPMYRYSTGGHEYYRCTGRGPQRRGCGNAVPVDVADAQVIDAMGSDHANPHPERVFIPGDNRSDEIGKLRERGAEAFKRGDWNAATGCMEIAKKLESLPTVAPHWEDSFTCHVCGSVKDIDACIIKGHGIVTQGEYFAGLDVDGRRNELAQNWIVSAHRVSDGEIAVTIVHRDFT